MATSSAPAGDCITLAQALARAQTEGLPRLEAQLLLLHALGKSASQRAWLVAHDGDLLEPPAQARFQIDCQRRSSGEPLAYLLGTQAFFGRDFWVDRRVLVPRADTETLVQWMLDVLPKLQSTPPGPIPVLELGTGSGAIAISVALSAAPHAVALTAVDLSAEALEVARANAKCLGADLTFLHSNWYSNVSGRFCLIASNPPYIAEDDAHLAHLQHEPRMALTAESGGLDDIHTLIAQAPNHLLPGGYLLLEHGWQQGQAVRALFEQAGFAQIQQRRDLAGIIRCTGGRWIDN